MRARVRLAARSASLLLVAAALGGCSSDADPPDGVSSFRVQVTKVNGADPPSADAPLPANTGDVIEEWQFTIQARSPLGDPTPFDGMVRLSVEPGAVLDVEGEGAVGRNIPLRGGVATGVARLTAVYGPARLWVEDIGYVPVALGKKPRCSNGVNDDPDADVLIDFPADPGCAFANDDTEEGGSFSAGNSLPVHYALPRVADIQGDGSATPYPFEGIQVNTTSTQRVVVTRVSSDGFYVTDLTDEARGYNHLFAFNFNTPANMRVCDRLEYLAGTVNEFFGFTELSFPSYQIVLPDEDEVEDAPCEVPEPRVLDAAMIVDPIAMERVESGLVRIEGYHITKNFGPKLAKNNQFALDQSNCDLNGDGQIDFESPAEGSCANACAGDPECTEWTGFSARGNYKVSSGTSMIQVQTGTVSTFDPTSHRGELLDAVTGTLRNFSGGSLNWTIEVRCPDDLACKIPGCVPANNDDLACMIAGCVLAAKSSKEACVRPRSLDDNDSETN